MGGRGSGNWIRSRTAKTTEDYYALDVGSFTRGNCFRPGTTGTTRWTRGDREVGSIAWAVMGFGRADALELRYRADGEDRRQRVGLDWTACHYGGSRPWFRCPRCDRRRGVLYGGPTFVCRICRKLVYPSSREAPYDRHLRRAQKIRQRLGGSLGLMDPLPCRPKWMHWRRYFQLRIAAEEAELRMWAAIADRLTRRG